jgi:uncharacterized membrane protein YeaQ/YmgE (transglycosylase-associated protein family)
VLGVVGAIVGGWMFATPGATPIAGFNIYSRSAAMIGATVMLVIYHALFGRRVSA